MTDDAQPHKPLRRSQSRPAPRATGLAAPSPARLMAIIRFLSDHSDRIIIGDHALERQGLRDLTDQDVFRILRLGECPGR